MNHRNNYVWLGISNRNLWLLWFALAMAFARGIRKEKVSVQICQYIFWNFGDHSLAKYKAEMRHIIGSIPYICFYYNQVNDQ